MSGAVITATEADSDQAVDIRRPAVGAELVEILPLQREAEIVGPELDHEPKAAMPSTRSQKGGDEAAEEKEQPIGQRPDLGVQWHRTGRQQRHLLALHQAIDGEGDHRRNNRKQSNDGPHLEIELADDLPVQTSVARTL